MVVSPSGLRLLGIALFVAGACSSGALAQGVPEAESSRNLSLETVPRTGDLDVMLDAYKLGHMSTKAGEAARKKAAADWAWGSEEGPPKVSE